ncbi:hypothetical protein MINTM020_21010 [Mycobacterium paraintracellulare]|nr:hypothetical protein MINTM020_21010 [Mycobacterium paraintracellulare]
MLLQDDNPDPRAGEQERVNETGGAPTGYANLGLKHFRPRPDPTADPHLFAA